MRQPCKDVLLGILFMNVRELVMPANPTAPFPALSFLDETGQPRILLSVLTDRNLGSASLPYQVCFTFLKGHYVAMWIINCLTIKEFKNHSATDVNNGTPSPIVTLGLSAFVK